jgi:hypothetical protein
MRYSSMLLFAFLTLFLVGCGDDSCDGIWMPGTSDTPVVGKYARLQFASTDVNVRSMARSVSKSATVADFEIGNIDKTSTYMFLLQNSGNVSATDIQLSSDNPAVTIVPSQIGILSPTFQGGIQPIIQVTVQHGLSGGGTGIAPVLDAGRLFFTISANATDNLSASATLGLNVRVSSYTLKSALSDFGVGTRIWGVDCVASNRVAAVSPSWLVWNINTDTFWGQSTLGIDGSLFVPTAQVTNTGNAPIHVQKLMAVGLDWVADPTWTLAEVAPSDSLIVPQPNGANIFKIMTHTVMPSDSFQHDANGAFVAQIEGYPSIAQ